jgi:hypothetical protein
VVLPSSSTATCKLLVVAGRQRGLAVDEHLRTFEIAPADLIAEGARIESESVDRLFEALVRESGDPTFPLAVAAAAAPDHY